MPRTAPIPDKEKVICDRLRQFRLSTRLSQVKFAESIGIDSTLLASYEHGRAPVRYGLVVKIQCKYALSESWLAEGKDRGTVLLPEEMYKLVPDRMLFSEAYERFVCPHLEKCLQIAARLYDTSPDKLTDQQLRQISSRSNDPDALAVSIVVNRFFAERLGVLSNIPEHLYRVLLGDLSEAYDKFLKRHAKEVWKFRQAQYAKRHDKSRS